MMLWGLVFALTGIVQSKILTQEAFQGELRKNDVPESMIETWTCIAQRGSNMNTSYVDQNAGLHGILQIKDFPWCFPAGRACSVTCKQMEDDDLADDIKCAMKMFNAMQRRSATGFSEWASYEECR